MEYSIKTGSGIINCTLVRKNMKNIRIRVTGASKVVVSAPHHSPESRIRQFIGDNEKFILSKLKEIADKRQKYYPAGYASGDTFWYLGEKTVLEVIETDETSAAYNDGVLRLHAPANADVRYRKALFILWMERRAKNIFAARAKEIRSAFPHLMGRDVRISVKNMLTRWGSVNPKRHTVSLSVHLLRCEPELIDYVIMHELCHFKYANHSKAFYAELTKHCANRKKFDKRLAEYGLIDF
ncbi:MAG: SprT family zinc-dependent metalloprotease [Eubacteriales bacterium]|nr:SprT family zinc-dependent metalloprotease [Eubacteriales bacterium]